MAFTTVKPSNYSQIIPRASSYGENYMDGTVVSALSQSASESYWFFPLPPNCIVTGGIIKGSQPASGVSGQAIVKLGTSVTDNLFGTYTISGGAALSTAISNGTYTVSTSSDAVPYNQPVIVSVTSGASATTSLSLYVRLHYVLPGKLNFSQGT